MSILSMARNRKQVPIVLGATMVLVMGFMILMAACFPSAAVAVGMGDVLLEVASRNSQISADHDASAGTEPVSGGSFEFYQIIGDLGTGTAFFSIAKPVGRTSMQAVIDFETGQLDEDAIVNVVSMNGYEMREVTYADYSWGLPNDEVEVWLILPQYLIQVELYETGYDKATNLQKEKDFTLQVRDGLEKAGLLSPAIPDSVPAGSTPITQPGVPAAEVTGTALDEPVKVSDTMNIAGVYNGPTVPTTFSVSSPHLVTYISTYHWNNARGASPGTIALKDHNGTIYGPWPVTSRPGQGGVPNAYWEVFPNLVIPAGTYTVVDSDPATWSQNSQSGGKGMGEVKATPHFEVSSGSVNHQVPGAKNGSQAGETVKGKSPAGVGAAGNIPGPSNITEAVIGVAVPGLIATALGALAGLGGGGGGGLVPPVSGIPVYPSGGGHFPGSGGTPGTGTGPAGTVQATNQIGRRKPEDNYVPGPVSGTGYVTEQDTARNNINDEILIDTKDMFEGIPAPGETPGSAPIIDTADETGMFVQSGSGIIVETAEEGGVIKPGSSAIIDTAEEAGVFVQPGSSIIIETIQEEAGIIKPGSGILVDDSDSGILIDTSALEDKSPAGAEVTLLSEESTYDQEGFNKEGFNAQGYDREGFNKEGFDAQGYDREGFNKEGFDAQGYDREGFNKEGFDAQGYDREGFNNDGFDREGYDKAGYDREGFNRQGFDKAGFDREGFNKAGYNAEGFDKEGFNKAGYDQEGYGRNGFNAEGFNREGFDVNGYNAKGYNRSGYDAKGFDAAGYDKEGFDKNGWDKEGFGRDGLNKDGFDREGYDKAGYDKDCYNREGYDREGRQQEGYDAEGYDKNGFNKDGFDRDGYDRDGFNYEGYNRAGYDPWGYDKQGYGKDGYHWSGYNADGYNRVGMHWTDNPYEGDSPFNVDTRNPFDGGTVIIDQDNYGNKVDLAGSWKPTKPPLGEPYPKTLEKYGAKPWTDEPQAPEPVTNSDISKPDIKDDTGFVPGPEDPQGTLEHHDTGTGNAAQTPEDSSTPENIPETGKPENSQDIPADQQAETGDSNTFTYTDPETGETTTYEYGEGYTGPRHGDTQILVGKADGQTYELKFDAVKGKWINSESGNEFNPDDFERWQNDLTVDKARAAEDLEKMAARQDANSKAIDKNLEDWHKLEQMQKAADKYNIGEHNGPGDVDKVIQELKDAMLEGKELDQEKMDKIRRVIDNRILGKTTADTGERWEEDWFKNLGWALEANAATAKEVLTGEKDDGSISWLGMGARIMITAATGGLAGAGSLAPVVMDGGLTIAEAMYRIKDEIDKGESDFRAISKAVGMVILGEEIGWLAGKTGGKLMGEMLEKFPVFTNKAADFLERGFLKIMKADLITSRGLGMISKESAEETLKQLEKRLTELGGDAGEEAMEKAAKGVGKAVSGSGDDIAGGSGKVISSSGDDIAKGSGKAVSERSGNITKGSGKAASGSSDDIVKGSGKAANTGSDDIAKGTTGKGASAGPDIQDGTGKTPSGKNDDIAPGTGKNASSGDDMAEGTRKTASGGDEPKRPDGVEGIGGKTGAGGPDGPDGPDGPGKLPSKESGDAADAAGKAPGTDEGAVKTGPVTSSLPEVNDYYSQPGKNAEIDSYAHINMDMERLRDTMKGNHLAAGESGAVYAAPPKAGVPAYEFTNTTTVRISDQNLVDVRIRTGPGGQTQYVTPRGEIIDPATLKDKVLMTPAPEGTGMVLTYYDPQGNIRSYIPAKFMERWSDAVKGFVPMG